MRPVCSSCNQSGHTNPHLVDGSLEVVELKSDALRERHWKSLMKCLRVSWTLSDLRLGDVWDADLLGNEQAVRDVLVVAQGEMGLEEFLKQVRDTWSVYEIDLVAYQVGRACRFSMARLSERILRWWCLDTIEQGPHCARLGWAVQHAQGAARQFPRNEAFSIL